MQKVLLEESVTEVNVLSSRFIAFLLPFGDPEKFQETYNAIKRRSPKADHYPFAYRAGENFKSGDDGEPSGAAGRPLLALLDRYEIDRSIVVIARYFGGSKLGLPRLRKTFVEAAEEAIKKARLGEVIILDSYHLEMSYHDYEEIKKKCPQWDARLENVTFETKVKATLLVGVTILPALENILSEESSYQPIGKVETIKEIKQ